MFVQRSCYCCTQLGLLFLLLTLLINIHEFTSVKIEVCMQPIYLLHIDLFPFLYNICFYNHLFPWELLPNWLALAFVLRLLEKVGNVREERCMGLDSMLTLLVVVSSRDYRT